MDERGEVDNLYVSPPHATARDSRQRPECGRSGGEPSDFRTVLHNLAAQIGYPLLHSPYYTLYPYLFNLSDIDRIVNGPSALSRYTGMYHVERGG